MGDRHVNGRVWWAGGSRAKRVGRRGPGMVLLAVAVILGGCEKKSGKTPAAATEGSAGGKAPAMANLPEVDVSKLSQGLQSGVQKLREAIKRSPRDADLVGNLGAIYYVHGFAQAAEACFERASKLAPESVAWHYYLALAHERNHHHKAALAEYEQAIELDPSYGPSYVRTARLLVDSDQARAEKLCRRALELNPKDQTALLMLGLAKAAKGELDEAAKHVREALDIDPNYREAHLALARILKEQKKPGEAEKELKLAEKGRTPLVGDDLFERLLRSGFNLEILLADARMLMARGAYNQADKALQRAAVVDPKNMMMLGLLGDLRVRQHRLEDAAKVYRRMLKLKPGSRRIQLTLARVLAALEKPDEAETVFKTLVDAHPQDQGVLEAYSQFLVTHGRGDDAAKLWRKVIEAQPDAAWAHLDFGDVLATTGHADEARAELGTVLKLHADDPGALWLLGELARAAGDTATAQKHWERIVATSPDYLQAYLGLTQLALARGDYAAALAYAAKGIERSPNAAGLLNTRAWILATCPDDKLRDGKEAVALAEKACKLTQRKQHELLDTLAAAYAEAGRFDEAVQTEAEAIKLATKSKSPQVDQYKQRLAAYQAKKPYHGS